MFKNFSQRLKRDLKNIVDARVAGSETAAGGKMKVRLLFFLHALSNAHTQKYPC
jgi:hypothetical protein